MKDLRPCERHLSQVRYVLAQRYRYYVLDDPIISDIDFDKAFKILIDLEAKYPDLVNDNSPSQYPESPPYGWKNYFGISKDRFRDMCYSPRCDLDIGSS